jgi:hypothetical protein
VKAGFLREVEKGKEVVSSQAKSFGAKMAQVSDSLENRLDGAINSIFKR